jgi:pyruvate/2-oxoglutarate dehydrogenase complex dihydrolipoamide acyltransferase (E2) component
VEKWLKREGQQFHKGESLCEVLLMPEDLMVAVDAKEDGIVGKLLVSLGQTVPINTEIAHYFRTKEDYFAFVDEMREAESDDERGHEADVMKAAAHQKPDTKVLMRVIKRLINEGTVKEGSGKIFMYVVIVVSIYHNFF